MVIIGKENRPTSIINILCAITFYLFAGLSEPLIAESAHDEDDDELGDKDEASGLVDAHIQRGPFLGHAAGVLLVLTHLGVVAGIHGDPIDPPEGGRHTSR